MGVRNSKRWADQEVDTTEYRSRSFRPTLKAKDLEGAMDMVVTIEDVEPNVMTHDNRKVMILHFEEFPKHNFWLSPKGIRILADKFGKKFTEWLGQKVPLVIVDAENPETGEQVDSLQVAAQVDWEDLMTVQPTAAMRERAAATTRKAARKSTGKTARKRR